MCRWIAYKGRPIFLEELLLKPCNSLIDQSLDCRKGAARTNGDGFGIGWYGFRTEPGVYREVLPAWNDCNLRALAGQIKSPLFFAHVRASTGTETARRNCHPFTHGPWLFMHNGMIGGYDRCRRELEGMLSDDLFAGRRGSTDSELFFLLMIQNGLDDDPLHAMRTSIEQITEIASRAGALEPLRLTICVSDGRRVYACRHSSRGVPPSLYWNVLNGDVLIASEPIDNEAETWYEILPDEILKIEDQIMIEDLFEGASGDGPGAELPLALQAG